MIQLSLGTMRFFTAVTAFLSAGVAIASQGADATANGVAKRADGPFADLSTGVEDLKSVFDEDFSGCKQ